MPEIVSSEKRGWVAGSRLQSRAEHSDLNLWTAPLDHVTAPFLGDSPTNATPAASENSAVFIISMAPVNLCHRIHSFLRYQTVRMYGQKCKNYSTNNSCDQRRLGP